MTNQSLENLRYPIGKFSSPTDYSTEFINECIATIEALPQQLKAAVEPLNEEQLNTPYRPEGWTVKQLVHHIADSHMNSYVRFKWTLTEDHPTIKPYDEKGWAELKDSEITPVSISLSMLEALHYRWVNLLKSFTADDWNLTLQHPSEDNPWTLKMLVGIYAWHSKHHLAHITNLIEREF